MNSNVNCRVPGQAHRVKNCGLHADCKREGHCVVYATLHKDGSRMSETKFVETQGMPCSSDDATGSTGKTDQRLFGLTQANPEQAQEVFAAAEGGSLVATPLLGFLELQVKSFDPGVKHAGVQPTQMMPRTSQGRKDTPLCSGVLDYFPLALAAVARLSKYGNDKHNPGQPLHWSRGKSSDHADCIARHLVDRGVIDPDSGESHTLEVAWRALALLEEEEEKRLGLPPSRGSR